MSDTGGSAFPVVGDYGLRMENSAGMTLRDYFAAKAMATALNNATLPKEVWQEYLPKIAKFSYAMADAMLEARKS